ncbi:hypothetical protein AAAC51_06320 [Priestia megaterium]
MEHIEDIDEVDVEFGDSKVPCTVYMIKKERRMQMNYVVKQSNFEEFIRTLLAGERKANVRMSESVSEEQELFAEYMSDALWDFIKRVRAAGYCPVVILSPIFREYDGWIASEVRRDLKHKIDEEFSIDMSDYNEAIDYSVEVYNKKGVHLKMKKDIRVLNHREYDINSFTPKARRKVVQLFDQHRQMTERLETLRKQYSVNLEIEDKHEVLNYQEEKRQLRARIEYVEALIYNINADYRNRSGITLRKIVYPVIKLIVNKFFPGFVSICF